MGWAVLLGRKRIRILLTHWNRNGPNAIVRLGLNWDGYQASSVRGSIQFVNVNGTKKVSLDLDIEVSDVIVEIPIYYDVNDLKQVCELNVFFFGPAAMTLEVMLIADK